MTNAPSPQPLISYRDVRISYGGREAVHGVSFDVAPGSIMGLVGESGSGKSTLVKAAMGLLGTGGGVTGGSIVYDGRDVTRLRPSQLRDLRGPQMGMVFQDCLDALCPIRTIGDQILEALNAHGSYSRARMAELACASMAELNLPDPQRILAGYPFELSGGMGQRVGISIATLLKPRLLLADEPTSALDVTSQAQVVKLLKRMREDHGMAIVVVTHNMGVVRAMCDDVLVLRNGEVVEHGPVGQVMHEPRSPYTRELLAATPVLHKRSAR